MAPVRSHHNGRSKSFNDKHPGATSLYAYPNPNSWTEQHDEPLRSPSSAQSIDSPPPSGGIESIAPGQEIQVANPHTRTYQACDECRRRKIKCDMGPVDNPHAPPCARCRRENRECAFAPTRRKKRKAKGEEDEDDQLSETPVKRKSLVIQQPRVPPPVVATTEEEDHSMSVLQQIDINSGYDSFNILISAAEGLSKESSEPIPSTAESANQLAAWERLQFVRRGWFTAKEGIQYITYFYRYLLPLTAISVSLPEAYNTSSQQIELLEQEPFLLVVMLTISSRYMKLTGPAASSRQSAIHDKLWVHLRGMVERTLWAQEQFGGGLCGAGPKSRDFQGLRTLGTVEGFMLLTEWHPRALHFPPSNDDDLMAPIIPEIKDTDSDSTLLLNGTGGQRRDSWLEPCWRSDRMCWMLLGHAISLAFEIGVFEGSIMSGNTRTNRLRKSLSVYFILLSGRLELIGKLPRGYLDSLSNDLDHALEAATLDPILNGDSISLSETERRKDAELYLLQILAQIMKDGNEQFFTNTIETRNLIRSGQYSTMVDQIYEPKLQNWLSLLQESNVSPMLKSVMVIEYEYCRVYLHSLAMQAVVERCTNNSPAPRSSHGRNGVNSASALPPSRFKDFYHDADRKHIAIVTTACQKILRIVTEETRGSFIRHASVRTYYRIIATAVILLKTFALGALESDVQVSLSLFDKLVQVFRSHIVDDVHIGNRFADMCETLVTRIRSRFVRISLYGNGSTSRGESPGIVTPAANDISMGPPRTTSAFPSMHNSRPPSTGPMMNSPYALTPLSAEMYDPMNHSIMPPPAMFFDESGQMPDLGNFDPSVLDGSTEWISLPLDPLLSIGGAPIEPTSLGPSVGGFDMLDVLLRP